MFDERFVTAARRVLAGDESVGAANALEQALHEDYPGDGRFEHLLEVLALYSPLDPSPYTGATELRDQVAAALELLTADQLRD